MKRPRASRRALAIALAGLGLTGLPLAGVVLGQQRPESLLPPGFGTPPAAAPAPAAPATPAPAAPGAPAAVVAPPPPRAGGLDPIGSLLSQLGEETPAEEPATEEAAAAPEELPDSARRPLSPVGMATGYGADAFGAADGRFLSILMTRMQAPIASRWMQIALRRALLTRVETPEHVPAADWVAARAALLLRLGEADGARMLVQSLDVGDFTPRLRTAAIATALATADPAGLCPLSDGPEQIGARPMWPMVRAMCTAMSGEPSDATIFPRGTDTGLRPIDEQVAEKVVGAGPASRRAIVLDWTLVDGLTDWRFGLASATGAGVPDDLLDKAAPRYRAWAARAPMLPLDKRIALARTAAVLGVFSSSDLVDLYGQALEAEGDYDRDSPPGLLRQAFIGEDDPARLTALRAIWKAADTPQAVYAAQILTARAAVAIAPESASNSDLAPLIAAMLAAGLDRQAERYGATVAAAGGEAGDRAWAMLATGAPRPVVPADPARVAAFAKRLGDDAESGGPQRTRLLIAALGGLGRIAPADLTALAATHGVDLARQTAWTRAIDRAVERREPGTVVLLAAIAMQTPGWGGVPAADFYRVIRALRGVGLDGEARMIAAEAMART